MGWLTWIAALCAYLVVGFAVAYLFGSFVRRVESPENASDLTPPMVTYLRPKKRAKTSSRVRATAQTKAQRKATGGP